jgi:hypothetical protein
MVRINDHLETIVREEIRDYNRARAHKAEAYVLCDDEQGLYAWLILPEEGHPFLTKPKVAIMAKISGSYVIIEEDTTDRPLYQELMRRGIPREQIILRYAGEKLPEKK